MTVLSCIKGILFKQKNVILNKTLFYFKQKKCKTCEIPLLLVLLRPGIKRKSKYSPTDIFSLNNFILFFFYKIWNVSLYCCCTVYSKHCKNVRVRNNLFVHNCWENTYRVSHIILNRVIQGVPRNMTVGEYLKMSSSIIF